MGIIVSKDQENTKLQQRISADLRSRMQSTSDMTDPDLAEGSDYVKDLKKTSRFSWLWLLLFVFAAASMVLIILI